MGWKDRFRKVKGGIKEHFDEEKEQQEHIEAYEKGEAEKKQQELYTPEREQYGGYPTTQKVRDTLASGYGATKKAVTTVKSIPSRIEGPKHKAHREREGELELIRSEARKKAIRETEEEYYTKKGTREGERIALGQTGFAYGFAKESTRFAKHFPEFGYSTKLTARIGTNINKNPLMRGIIGPVRIPKTKTLKQGRPIIKIYLGDKKKHKGRRQKKQRRSNFWNLETPF